MTQRITVLRSNQTKPEGKNYTVVELAYKTDDGKTKGMKIFGFGPQAENAKVAANAKSGDILEANFQQNAKGYWEFSSLKATGETSQVAQSATPTTGVTATASRSGGNWETSEERAKRQVMIVRQSSLSTAVALKPKASVEEVIDVAKQFEAYVLGTEVASQPTGDVQ
jgi:hypothetical protein